MTTVTENAFVAGCIKLFDLSGKLKVATNEVIESWTPIIRQRMEAAGVESNKDKAPQAEQVRVVFFDLFVEFFNSCPKAMAMLKTMSTMKCMGFDALRGTDHLERLIKEIKWAGLGPQIEYVYKTCNDLFTDLGYRQRDKNAAQLERERKAKEKAEGKESVKGETVPQETAKTAIGKIVSKEVGLYEAICQLMEAYGIEAGEDGANWQAQLAACNDYVEQQAKAQAAAQAKEAVPVAA